MKEDDRHDLLIKAAEAFESLKAENGRLRNYMEFIGERMEKVSDEQGVCKAVVDRWIREIREALSEGK